jgi:hypothetical protein
MATPPR